MNGSFQSIIPQGIQTEYSGNYVSLPVNTLKAPIEGNRSVPVDITWSQAGAAPNYIVHFNAREQRVTPITQIASIHVNNLHSSVPVNIIFPDTQFEIELGAGLEGFYPVTTNSLEFFAYTPLPPAPGDAVHLQVLNFLPPPVIFGTNPGGTPVGVVTSLATGPGLTGGPITGTGTVSLIIPVAIASGGTQATSANQALDNLSGASGTVVGLLARNASGQWLLDPLGSGGMPALPLSIVNGGTGASTGFTALDGLAGVAGQTGVLTRASNGTWSLSAAGSGTITGVTAGPGLSGGGASGGVTVSLVTPVAIGNGGTGSNNGAGALDALAGFSGTMTGLMTRTAGGGYTLTAEPLAISAGGTGATTAAAGPFVQKAGDTMTGALSVNTNAAAIPAPGSVQLHLQAANGANSGFDSTSYGATNQVSLRAARGTAALPTASQLGDFLGIIDYDGYNGSAFSAAPSVRLLGQSLDNMTTTANGGQLVLQTTTAGTTTLTTRMVAALGLQVFDASGNPPAGGDLGGGSINAASTIRSNGQFISYGATAGVNFCARDDNSQWIWYANAGLARLNHSGGDQIIINASNGDLRANYFSGTATTYTSVFAPGTAGGSPAQCILLGNSVDPTTYYRNTSQIFADQTGSNILLTILLGSQTFGGGGVVCGSPTGGAKGGGTLNAVQVYGNNVLLTSDATLKTDIAPLPPALPLVTAVAPRTFKWKAPPAKASLGDVPGGPDGEMVPSYLAGDGVPEDFTTAENRGFLAQDFAAAGLNRVGADGTQSLDMGALVATLWQAVRELSDKVAALEGAH